jgi:hypothetical protein
VLSISQFLEACRSVEAALDQASPEAVQGLQRCSREFSEARWNPEELDQAARALMHLRLRVESKSRFFRIRAGMARTLVRLGGRRKPAGPTIDRTF